MQASRARQALAIVRVATYLVAALVLLVVLAAALIDAGFLQNRLINMALARAGRPVRINGAIEAHLLSRHPGIIASRVEIDNPPWVAPGPMARIGRLEAHWDLPTLRRGPRLATLQVDDATFHFLRDADGKANWQSRPPESGRGNGPPLLRLLQVPHARVTLQDARRHLEFDGVVDVGTAVSGAGAPQLRIEGRGQLNGRESRIVLNGDALASTRADRPYHFDFDERSSRSRLSGNVVVPQPFDFRVLDANFTASGEDMKDLYYLTGVTLPKTASYHLSGKFERRGSTFKYSGLSASSGMSDMRGTLVVETSAGHARLTADLHSHRLHLADLGARAGLAPDPQARLMFAETLIPLKALRRADATIQFRGDAVDVGRLSLQAVSTGVIIQNGKLVATPFDAHLALGSVHGRAELDATQDPLKGRIELRTSGVELAELPHAARTAEPPLSGRLQARITLAGRGQSLHELMATSDGTVTLVVPHGSISATLAESSGMDLRAVGLKLARDTAQTPIRCGVASFEARAGIFTAKQLVIDTDPVLVGGAGTIDLNSERLDLSLRGAPKHPRLRLRTPVVVGGTLLHPSFGVGAGSSAPQAVAAVALGVVLTPLAAVLAFVDPGLAKDADCATLIASAALPPKKP